MAKKIPNTTTTSRGDTTWPFPRKLLTESPKRQPKKKVDTKQYERAVF